MVVVGSRVVRFASALIFMLAIAGAALAEGDVESSSCGQSCIATESDCIGRCPEGEEGDACEAACVERADRCLDACEGAG